MDASKSNADVGPGRRGRSGWLLWAGIVAVAGFELYAASLILHPRVDAPYRAYYIDHSSDCWLHVTPADYTPGTTLSFLQGKPNLFFPNKLCGWFYPNDRGTWSYGAYSLLRFKFPPTGAPLTLTFTAGAMVDAAHPVQRVRLSVGDTELGEVSFDSMEPQTRTVTIPAAVAATSAEGLTLRFDYPDARPGSELGPNEDAHLRAIRMIALTLGDPTG